MRNIKALIEYDGTGFKGFQIQPLVRTVQGELEKALQNLTQEKVKVIGAGRTDAGVHALGQVINFSTAAMIPVERFPLALNRYLPEDLRVLAAEEVAADFHARFTACWKTYRYLFRRGKTEKVFWRNYALVLPADRELNLRAMQKAARFLVGKHDFSAFCASGSEVKNYERTIWHCGFRKWNTGWALEVTADGFLYHMIRNIFGPLQAVGEGKLIPEDIPQILASRQRSQAGPTAPPQGLYLVQVGYYPWVKKHCFLDINGKIDV